MPNPRLEQFTADLHQEVLAAAGIDADKVSDLGTERLVPYQRLS
jgi:hypothetical protein